MSNINDISVEAYIKYILVSLIRNGQFYVSLLKYASIAPRSNLKSFCQAQDILGSTAILELTVSKLEDDLVALQCQLSWERSECRLLEYRLRHLSCLTPSL